MHQEPYLYHPGAEIPAGDARFQYQSPYQMQPTMNSWPSNFTPSEMKPPNFYPSNIVNPVQSEEPSGLLPPVSTAMYGTTSTFSWAHTVPSLMPWVPRAEATVPDPVVRFSAPFPPDPCTSQTATSWELLHNLGANRPNPNLHLKRKGDTENLELTPPKLCVTEEKMAARFRDMHISNQYTVPENSLELSIGTASCTPADKPVTNLQQLELMLNDSNASSNCAKSLILAPELKKLVEPEKILSTFLNKIDRPSMAVVVWQPPNKTLIGESDKKQNHQVSLNSDSGLSMEDNNNVASQHYNIKCQQYLPSFVHSNNQQVISEETMDT